MLRSLSGALVAACVLGLAPGRFQGCLAPAEPDRTGALPTDGGLACTSDDDCSRSTCADSRCAAGRCIEVGPLWDRDGDGEAPPPCGEDCDDARPDVFGGAPESCDLRDNDCDGEVDEGAEERTSYVSLPVGDGTSVLAAWGQGFLVTEATPAALFGHAVALDGSVGAPAELLRLASGSRFTRVAAATSVTGDVLLMAVTDLGAVRYAIVRPDARGAPTRVEGPAAAGAPADTQDVAVEAHADGFAIAYDAEVDGARAFHVALAPNAAPIAAVTVVDGGLEPTPLAIASTGDGVAVPRGVDSLAFVEAATGATLANVELPGTLAGAMPLAPADGAVVAAVGVEDAGGDEVRWALVEVRADGSVDVGAGGPRMSSLASGGGLALERVGDEHVLAALGRTSVIAFWRYAADRSTAEELGLGVPYLAGPGGAPRTSFVGTPGTYGALGFLAASPAAREAAILFACAED